MNASSKKFYGPTIQTRSRNVLRALLSILLSRNLIERVHNSTVRFLVFLMSGSGGGGGYEYQAIATAYIAVHILLQKRLDWIENLNDLPIAVAEETDGPGDDIRITLQDEITIELQAKHGLQKNKLWEPIVKL